MVDGYCFVGVISFVNMVVLDVGIIGYGYLLLYFLSIDLLRNVSDVENNVIKVVIFIKSVYVWFVFYI